MQLGNPGCSELFLDAEGLFDSYGNSPAFFLKKLRNCAFNLAAASLGVGRADGLLGMHRYVITVTGYKLSAGTAHRLSAGTGACCRGHLVSVS